MRIKRYVLLGLFLLASVIGIYGQSMVYLLEDLFNGLNSVIALTILTSTSIILYLAFIFSSLYLYGKRGKSDGRDLFVIFIGIILAVIVSMGSLFVLAMWWG